MISSLINIRIRQAGREIQGLGLFRTVVLLIFGILLLALLFIQTKELPNAIYASSVVLLLIFILHNRRKDKNFLRIAFDRPYRVMFVEYLLILMVLVVFLLIHRFWYIALASIAIGAVIPHIDLSTRRSGYNSAIQRRIPDGYFEWISGVRRYLLPLIIIWGAGILLSCLIAAVPVALFLLGVIFLNFFENNEPFQMIVVFEKGPKQFLWQKIQQQLVMGTVVSAPLAAAFAIFHPHLWYVSLLLFVAFNVLLMYVVLVKYAFYEPDTRSYAAQVFIAIGILGLLIPVFLPLVLLLSVWFYLKAGQKLKFYLNDYL